MREITEDEFTAALRQAVESRGADYRYDKEAAAGGVFYSLDGEVGSCIMGVTFEILGLGLPTEGKTISTYIVSLEDSGDVKFDPGVHTAAGVAQSVQDSGGTWGEALIRYEEAFTTIRKNLLWGESKMSKLTEQALTEAIIKAVKWRGTEHVIRDCRYTDEDGSGSCLIGAALEIAGFPLPEHNSDKNYKSADLLLSDSPYNAPEWLAYAAHKGQQSQDFGLTWGVALNRYLEEVIIRYHESGDTKNEARIEALLPVTF